MSHKKETGNWGEDLAADYLKREGYEILERNWRFSKAEIDIICKKGGLLIFVEVKTRSSVYFGQPEEFVSDKQFSLIADASFQYMIQSDYQWAFRFDVIGIVAFKNKGYRLRHIEDAYFPGI